MIPYDLYKLAEALFQLGLSPNNITGLDALDKHRLYQFYDCIWTDAPVLIADPEYTYPNQWVDSLNRDRHTFGTNWVALQNAHPNHVLIYSEEPL